MELNLSPQAQVIETMFNIQAKSGEKVPFRLNPTQVAYDVKRTNRDLIPKARQKGFSSLGIGYQVVDCLTTEGCRCVLISHEAKATQRLLDKARYYIKHINGPEADLGRRSRSEFYFKKTESTFYIGTAGAKAFGRGDTITHLHISEYAWWERDALDQVAGLFQAVPMGGTIRIESTGNGRGNDFYYMCMNAEKLQYQVNFRSWHEDDEYFIQPPERGWEPEGFEHYFQDMKLHYNLTSGQLYWYYMKLLEFRGNLGTMQQEYPSNLKECFQATGGAVFPGIEKVPTTKWKWKLDHKNRRVNYHEDHPNKKYHYILGADPSGGTGHDEAGVQGFCIETLEQVFEYGSNRVDPVDFGYLLSSYGRKYNDAFIVCESNHHGIATHSILKKEYDGFLIYKRKVPMKGGGAVLYGFITTENTKAQLIGAIRECIDMGLRVYGSDTEKQLIEFEETPEGKMGAPEDGLVIALGMVCIGLMKWLPQFDRIEIAEDPFAYRKRYEDYKFSITYDDIFKDLLKKRNVKPILPRMLNT